MACMTWVPGPPVEGPFGHQRGPAVAGRLALLRDRAGRDGVRAMAERRLTHRLGNRVVDGVELRSLPQVELPWITTFNMRWWDHADEVGSRGEKRPQGQAGLPT